MQILNHAQTTAHLGFEQLVAALDDMFVQGCQVPLRHAHTIEDGQGPAGTLLLMPAWQPGGRLGVKTVSIFPKNHEKQLPGLHSTYLLFDATTGVPIAMLDGDVITSRRTAAASALAATRLSRPDAKTLLIVGSGRVAELLAHAYQSVRPIETVMVWNVRTPSALRLVDRLCEQGIDARHVTDLQAAVHAADIVTCATLSDTPLIQGDWLQPGTHLDLIGSFTPAMRETDAVCFERATVFVDTDEALAKSGDILQAIEANRFSHAALGATLTQLCRGEHPGRTRADEITLFKSVGTALEDLAAASLAWDAYQAG